MSSLLADDDWVLLSEIEHWAYCPRQWALIHLEQWFTSNDDTVRGDLAHEHLDDGGHRTRGPETTWWSVDVWSDPHQIRGRCDRVMIGADGSVVPVEHKSGRRHLRAAELQLAGQAMCLESMLAVEVPVGRLYLVASNELHEVPISEPLRNEVLEAAEGVRAWRKKKGALLPDPANDHRCPSCSLRPGCMPALVGAPNRVRGLHGATWWP